MEKKRFIFDLDNTLLTFNSEYQNQFFKNELGENNPFTENLSEYLELYWANYKRFEKNRFASLLSFCSGVTVTEEFIDKWIDALTEMPIVLEEGVADTLDYLRIKGKSLAVLTNWYGSCQIEKLKKARIISFFDRIYSGEYVLKPNHDAYQQAAASYHPSTVAFIGDDLENDYIAPRESGYDAILYDKNEKYPKNLVKVKKMSELKERY